jgi:hypothetical protein
LRREQQSVSGTAVENAHSVFRAQEDLRWSSQNGMSCPFVS